MSEHERRAEDALRTLDGNAWSPPEPPALDREAALAARPERGRRAWVAGRGRAGRAITLRPAGALAAVAVLLAVGGGAGALLAGGDDTGSSAAPPGRSVPLAAIGAAPAGERVVAVLPGHSGGDVRLRVRGAKPTPAGHVEEVWFMTDAKRLTAVGTFRVGRDGRADVRFHTAEDPRAYRYVDVSVEPQDGDPGHSSDSVLRSGRLS